MLTQQVVLKQRIQIEMVPSPSGKAAACKAAIPGSNPGGTSIDHFLSDLSKDFEENGSIINQVLSF